MAKLIDEAALDAARSRPACEICHRRPPRGMMLEAAHYKARGMGGAARIDASWSVFSACRDCHQSLHDGNIDPRNALEAIAAREGRTTEEIEQMIDEQLRRPKTPKNAAKVTTHDPYAAGAAARLKRRQLRGAINFAPHLPKKPEPKPSSERADPVAKEYPVHELANQFPRMSELDFSQFQQNISEFGLREKIVLLDKHVLDGASRQKACSNLGIAAEYREFGDDPMDGDDPAEFVKAKNLHRRHLDASQRAFAAAGLVRWIKEHRPPAEEPSEPQDFSEEEDTNGEASTTKLVNDQAGEFGASPRAVYSAMNVQENAHQDIKDAVQAGEISVHDAEGVLELNKKDQRKALSAVRAGKSKTLRQAAGPKKRKKSANGQVVFDDKKIDAAFGALVRLIDDRAFAKADKAGHKELLKALNDASMAWKRLQKAVAN